MDWYPHYINDYDRDTLHLSTLEHGAYLLLIHAYMRHGKPLPNDDAVLARIAKMDVADWAVIAPTVRAFFDVRSDAKIFHKRCEKELRIQSKLRKADAERKRAMRLKRKEPGQEDVRSDVQRMSVLTDKTRQTYKKEGASRPFKNGSSGQEVRSSAHDPDNELKAWARTIKGGKPCFHATPGRIAEMEAKGYLTSDEAQAWREANGHAH